MFQLYFNKTGKRVAVFQNKNSEFVNSCFKRQQDGSVGKSTWGQAYASSFTMDPTPWRREQTGCPLTPTHVVLHVHLHHTDMLENLS